MRIRAAVTTLTLAATMVLGGAATALAHGDDDHNSGSAHHGACYLAGGVHNGNPGFAGGCEWAGIDWR
ncbi:hypothetical protein ACIGQE_17505 [Streptomyces sp. NPDC053429]|uniref:hypothetical protein n=1 Tax=unclassified Streptomyces TaxID=2593676 RepID=UPI0033E8C466